MSENSPSTDSRSASRGRSFLHGLWSAYQRIAICIGSVIIITIIASLLLFVSRPGEFSGVNLENLYHIPTRYLCPADTQQSDKHTLLVHTSAAFDEAAFTADLLSAGWQPRPHEQAAPWRSFDRLGMTLRLFSGGIFVLPTWLDEPCTTPTHLREIIIPPHPAPLAALYGGRLAPPAHISRRDPIVTDV